MHFQVAIEHVLENWKWILPWRLLWKDHMERLLGFIVDCYQQFHMVHWEKKNCYHSLWPGRALLQTKSCCRRGCPPLCYVSHIVNIQTNGTGFPCSKVLLVKQEMSAVLTTAPRCMQLIEVSRYREPGREGGRSRKSLKFHLHIKKSCGQWFTNCTSKRSLYT